MRNVSGEWSIIQGNGFAVSVDLAQNDKQPSGQASYSAGGGTVHSLETDGSVTDTDFSLNIAWNNGTRGIYTANFAPDGRLVGETFDQEHPESQATWHSDRTFALL